MDAGHLSSYVGGGGGGWDFAEWAFENYRILPGRALRGSKLLTRAEGGSHTPYIAVMEGLAGGGGGGLLAASDSEFSWSPLPTPPLALSPKPVA